MGDCPSPFVRGEIVVGDRGPRRPLIRRAMYPERGGEAMKVIDIVGEQVGPFEAPPFPDRLVDVNRASPRQRARAAVGACVHGVGPRALANADTDAAGNVNVSLSHRLISPAHSAHAR